MAKIAQFQIVDNKDDKVLYWLDIEGVLHADTFWQERRCTFDPEIGLWTDEDGAKLDHPSAGLFYVYGGHEIEKAHSSSNEP